MSTTLATHEDFAFFDYLAPIRWPNTDYTIVSYYRQLVATGELQIETLLENALVVASNNQYERVATHGYDFSDFSDAKKAVSCFRCNNIAKGHYMNTISVTGITNKRGLLRVMAYSKYSNQFYYFAIPHSAYRGLSVLEIPLDRSTKGPIEPLGIPRGKWMAFQVPDFYSLARITPDYAEYQYTSLLATQNNPCRVVL